MLSQKQQFKKTASIASYCFYADVISKYNNYPRITYDLLVIDILRLFESDELKARFFAIMFWWYFVYQKTSSIILIL
jgi:hypothetical protein